MGHRLMWTSLHIEPDLAGTSRDMYGLTNALIGVTILTLLFVVRLDSGQFPTRAEPALQNDTLDRIGSELSRPALTIR